MSGEQQPRRHSREASAAGEGSRARARRDVWSQAAVKTFSERRGWLMFVRNYSSMVTLHAVMLYLQVGIAAGGPRPPVLAATALVHAGCLLLHRCCHVWCCNGDATTDNTGHAAPPADAHLATHSRMPSARLDAPGHAVRLDLPAALSLPGIQLQRSRDTAPHRSVGSGALFPWASFTLRNPNNASTITSSASGTPQRLPPHASFARTLEHTMSLRSAALLSSSPLGEQLALARSARAHAATLLTLFSLLWLLSLVSAPARALWYACAALYGAVWLGYVVVLSSAGHMASMLDSLPVWLGGTGSAGARVAWLYSSMKLSQVGLRNHPSDRQITGARVMFVIVHA